ncbi:MAG: CapA family protein [Polyangiaceae bacterium]|nr:CapA family protein [Polyangiaceae bacterium]
MNVEASGPPSGQAGRHSAGVHLASRLVGASFAALALALVGSMAWGPPRLPEGALPTPEITETPSEDVRRPGESLVVVALGAFDPAQALRRLGPSGAAPPDAFAPLATLLGSAHFRLLGISPMEPTSPGAFLGPLVTEEGAKLVGRGGFNLAVLGHPVPERAGRRGLAEGAARLREAGLSTLGTGTPEEPWGPLRLIVEGRRVAWLALDSSAGPDANPAELTRRIAALREEGEADAVLVVVHAGERFATAPSEPARRLFRAAADAGADVVLGLRPALLQGVEWRHGVPLLYGIGNPLSPSDREHPEAAIAALARLRFGAPGPPAVEICPLRADVHAIAPLALDSLRFSYEATFWQRLRLISRPYGNLTVSPPSPDGCATLLPPPPLPAGSGSARPPGAPAAASGTGSMRPPASAGSGSRRVPAAPPSATGTDSP